MRDREIPTEYVNIATERIMRSFGDVIGGNPQVMTRIVFGVITGDITYTPEDEEEGDASLSV